MCRHTVHTERGLVGESQADNSRGSRACWCGVLNVEHSAGIASPSDAEVDGPVGWPMEARHGPPRVGTMIWASRAALGAGDTDKVIHKRDEEPHRAGP